jgi:tryptophan synthase beta subunit
MIRGRFGPYGGRYVPETLVAPLEEFERAYAEARADGRFGANSTIFCCEISPGGPRRCNLLRG